LVFKKAPNGDQVAWRIPVRDPRLSGRGGCTSRILLDQISGKWSVLILAALCEKPLRFNAIRRCLDGVTQKALTQSLRRLERNGIVSRRIIPASPVAVEYSITPLGRTLEAPFRALNDWSIRHLAEVETAQSAFDRRADAGIVDAAEIRIDALSKPRLERS
jgi:DNA-binding HxlR family transcriptional regulator